MYMYSYIYMLHVFAYLNVCVSREVKEISLHSAAQWWSTLRVGHPRWKSYKPKFSQSCYGGTSRCLERHHPFIGFNGYFGWHMNDIWMKCWLMPSDIGSKAKTDVFGNSTSMSFWESKLQRFLHPDRPQRENRWNYGGCSVYTISFFFSVQWGTFLPFPS